ncbi:hypothetical protein IIB51_01600 [Patescibacteria group bacterium]|nr:hypothetical protein [Patescibacteria group bacterium]
MFKWIVKAIFRTAIVLSVLVAVVHVLTVGPRSAIADINEFVTHSQFSEYISETLMTRIVVDNEDCDMDGPGTKVGPFSHQKKDLVDENCVYRKASLTAPKGLELQGDIAWCSQPVMLKLMSRDDCTSRSPEAREALLAKIRAEEIAEEIRVLAHFCAKGKPSKLHPFKRAKYKRKCKSEVV